MTKDNEQAGQINDLRRRLDEARVHLTKAEGTLHELAELLLDLLNQNLKK